MMHLRFAIRSEDPSGGILHRQDFLHLFLGRNNIRGWIEPHSIHLGKAAARPNNNNNLSMPFIRQWEIT